jgi:hypothetical protein
MTNDIGLGHCSSIHKKKYICDKQKLICNKNNAINWHMTQLIMYVTVTLLIINFNIISANC